MQSRRDPILDSVELLVHELAEQRPRGLGFRVIHCFRKPGTICGPGEEIAAVPLVHQGREYWLPLPLSLRILFDYLARARYPQSAAQIVSGIRRNPLYVSDNATSKHERRRALPIPRSFVRVYIERLRLAIRKTLNEAGLTIEARDVLLSQRTVTNEMGYRLLGHCEWIHIDALSSPCNVHDGRAFRLSPQVHTVRSAVGQSLNNN